MRAIAHALAAAGRVDDDTADALCRCVFRAMDSSGCREVAVGRLGLRRRRPAAPPALRRSVEKISANIAGTMDAAAVAAVCGGAAATRRRRRRGGRPSAGPSRLAQGRRRRAALRWLAASSTSTTPTPSASCGLGVSSPPRGLRGPSGALRGRVASRRDSLSLKKGVGPSGAPDASGEFGKRRGRIERAIAVQVVGHIRFMSSSAAKKKRRPAPRWPPRELRWRAAAVDLLAAYASIANTDELNDEKIDSPAPPSVVEALLDVAARCSLVNTVHFFEGDPKGEEGGAEAGQHTAGYVDVGEWPADSLVATQLASFRLATLRAFNVIHGGENARDPPLKRFGRRGGNVGYSNALVALCGTPVRPLPDSNLGSACVVALRLAGTARRRRGRGAVGERRRWRRRRRARRAASLRRLGRSDEEFSGFGFGVRGFWWGFVDGSRDGGPRGDAAGDSSARSRFYAPSTPPRCVSSAEAGIVVKGGDDSNPKGDDSNLAAVRRIELDDSGSPRPRVPRERVRRVVALADSIDSNPSPTCVVATSLARVAGAIGRSRWSGPRTGASPRDAARAAELGGGAAAESLLTRSRRRCRPRRRGGDDNRR